MSGDPAGPVGPLAVRDATAADGAACAAVYAPYVLTTAATFETEPPGAEEMASRVAASQAAHAWLVAERAGQVVGYAHGGPWKPRAAYAWTCEVSVYLAPGERGRGTGRALYEVLLPRLAALGHRSAIAGATLPNPASEALHRSLGFVPVGTFRRSGWKLGAWHDVGYLQLALGDDSPPGPPPG